MTARLVQLPSWRPEQSDIHIVAGDTVPRTRCGRHIPPNVRRRLPTKGTEPAIQHVCASCVLLVALADL